MACIAHDPVTLDFGTRFSTPSPGRMRARPYSYRDDTSDPAGPQSVLPPCLQEP